MPAEESIKEVFAHFGAAIFQSNCIEEGLQILLATKWNETSKPLNRQQYDAELLRLERKTFGALLKLARPRSEHEILLEVEEALAKRNWLAHHYFAERAIQFNATRGQELMIQELSEIGAKFRSLQLRLLELIGDWMEENGMPRYVQERDLEAILKNSPWISL